MWCFRVQIFLTLKYIVSPLQWGSKAFRNMRIIPPGSGIVHQVNLEYLARVVFKYDGYFYPDSLVGTDSHTTMIDGLGVLGWGKNNVSCTVYRLPSVGRSCVFGDSS